jgi:hypothetical protein
MAIITRRYDPEEFRRLTELIYPEERRYEFTDQPWGGVGFRHYLDRRIICIEHFMVKGRSIQPPTPRRKPAA